MQNQFTPMQRNMATVYILDGDDVLLLYRRGSRVISDCWTGTAGGHFEPEELNDARACVLRELYEETGLRESDLCDLTLRYITLRRKNNEIRQNYYFFASLREPGRAVTSNEGDIHRFGIKEAAALEMPYSAKFMYEHYLKVGRHNDKLYCGAAMVGTAEFCELPET